MKKFLFSLALVLILPLSFVFVGCSDKLQSIRIDLTDVKVEYIEGQPLNLNNIKIYARFSEKGEKEVDTYTIDTSKVDTHKAGEYEIVVNFENKSKSFTVNYYTKGTMAISPNTKYFIGQNFKSANPEIKYTTGKGKIIPLYSDYSVVSFDNKSAGEKTAVLSYNGYTYEVKVEVLGEEDYFEYVLSNLKSSLSKANIGSVTFKEGGAVKAYFNSQLVYTKNQDNDVYYDLTGFKYERQLNGLFGKSQKAYIGELNQLQSEYGINNKELSKYYQKFANELFERIDVAKENDSLTLNIHDDDNSKVTITIELGETSVKVEVDITNFILLSKEETTDMLRTIIINSQTNYQIPV